MDDYIQQGIHGIREIKPDERRKFLGTLRERVVVALTKQQVREPGTYKEKIEDLMKKNKDATLFLNGTMDYSEISDYIKIANKIGSKFLISTNKEANTDLGLVLAYDHAINKEDIYIKKQKEQIEEQKHENHISQFFKKIF